MNGPSAKLPLGDPISPVYIQDRRWRPVALRYGLAVVAVAVAAWLRWVLQANFGPLPLFITLYPAVLLVASLAGGGPGIVATLLAVLVADYLFVSPIGSFRVAAWNDLLALIIFFVTNLFLCVLAERLRRLRWAQAVARQQELMAVTLAGVGDGVIVTDTAGRVTFMNDEAQRLTGWASVEARGKALADVFRIINNETGKAARDPAQEVLREGTVVGLESNAILVARDGRHIPVDDSAAPIRRSGSDSIEGVVLVFRDMIDRVRSLAELREREEQLQLFTEHAPAAIAMFDNQMRYVAASQRWLRDYGLVGQDLRGRSHYDVFPEIPQQWREIHQRCLAGAVESAQEDPFTRADGTTQWLRWEIRPWFAAGGAIGGIIIFSEDITAQKLTQEESHLHSAAMQAAANGIAIVGRDGRIQWVNQAFTVLTGYSAEEVVGQNPRVLKSGLHDAAFYQNLWDIILGKGVWRGELVNKRKDGTLYNEEMTITPVTDAVGTITHFIAIKQDVTFRKQMEANLQSARDAAEAAKAVAEAASRAKDHFLAVLSHELRTPLTPVMAALGMLQSDGRFDADTRENLEMIRRNVELEARLIDDLLDMTRIARGKILLERTPLPLRQVVHRAVEVCRSDIRAKGLEFVVADQDFDCDVNGDATRLQQVFWNLLRNAIKFTPPGGRLGVHCQREDGMAVVEVIDSGEGIDAQTLPRIFNAFEQGQRSLTRNFGGLGLGLTISKALVELHGGTIAAYSEGSGKGATLTVRLPILAAGSSLKTVAASPAPAAAAIRPLRILLVEDHVDSAKVMRRLLMLDGHRVELASDVAAALHLAANDHFDLLISDLGLPDRSGLDLMRDLRSRGSSIPGIALSGYGQEEHVRQALEAGFATHLTKPATPQRLAQTIEQIMRV